MKYMLIFAKSLLVILLISSVAWASPNIDGYFNPYGDEWAGNLKTEIGDDYGGDFDVKYLGLFLNDGNLSFMMSGDYEFNYGEDGWGPGDIAMDFSAPGTDGADRSYQVGFRFASIKDPVTHANIVGVNDVGAVHNAYDVTFESYQLDDRSDWDTAELYNTWAPWQVDTDDPGVESIPDYFVEAKYTRDPNNPIDPAWNTLEATINMDALSDKLIDLGVLQTDTDYDVRYLWTMQCGNDVIKDSFAWRTSGGGGGTNPVPEPATMLLLGSGLLGLAGFRRKK